MILFNILEARFKQKLLLNSDVRVYDDVMMDQ